MNRLLEGQVALITGGNRGIGYAIAQAYLQEGARVAICGRSDLKLQEAEQALRKKGESLTLRCDVTDLDQVKKMAQQIIDRFGRIDILVNNAGVGMTYGRVGEVDPAEWAYVISVNLVGAFNCCHAVLPQMLRQARGKIINLKGYGADFPSPRVTAYGASKAAIVAFTKSLAKEYRGTGVTANYLSPGVVKTELLIGRKTTDEGRPHLERVSWLVDLLAGPVERPAAMAVKMASAESDAITGKEFRVMSKGKVAGRLIRLAGRRVWERKRHLKLL